MSGLNAGRTSIRRGAPNDFLSAPDDWSLLPKHSGSRASSVSLLACMIFISIRHNFMIDGRQKSDITTSAVDRVSLAGTALDIAIGRLNGQALFNGVSLSLFNEIIN
jgi:hypothetical protein